MVIVVLSESLNVFGEFPLGRKIITNLTILAEFVCYFAFFYFSYELKWIRRFMLGYALVYLLAWVANSLYNQDLNAWLQVYPYMFGALGVLLGVILYFHQELLVNPADGNFHSRYFFWICSGMFLFFATDIPVMGTINYMVEHGLTVLEWPIMKIKHYVSAFYYSLFTVGLIWAKTE